MIAPGPLSFFTDPILRAPTLGCMLMGLAAGLMGVLVFLRKQSLIGEALSHAAYPGVIAGVIGAGFLSLSEAEELPFSAITLGGAFCTALLGLWAIRLLERRMKVPNDAALCFVLSSFFGIGLTLASEVQFSFSALYKQALSYLYGQAATMTDTHVVLYGGLVAIVLLLILLLYKELQVIAFDEPYAESLGIPANLLHSLLFFLVALTVIIGIRSVGVVLMSAMLITPAVAARQFTHRLSRLFALAAFFSLASGFFGNYLSVKLTEGFVQGSPGARITLPTGPMIVVVAATFCGLALLFAPERGMVVRLWRVARFRHTCICENLLKAIWRIDPQAVVNLDQMAKYQAAPRLYLLFLLKRMARHGWIEERERGTYALTLDGQHRAAKIVRLHRLWELYLTSQLGMGVERVHQNAEAMEHIITPELERELTLLLEDPKRDPHQQPIPPFKTHHVC